MVANIIYWGFVYLFLFLSILWCYNTYKFLVGFFYLPGDKTRGYELVVNSPLMLLLMIAPITIGILLFYLVTILFAPPDVALGGFWRIVVLSITIPVIITSLIAFSVHYAKFKFNIRSLCVISLLFSLIAAAIYLFRHPTEYSTLPSVLGLISQFLSIPTILSILITARFGSKKVNRNDDHLFCSKSTREENIEW